MEKYIEAINNISSYEIWHECTYDDGYSNFDDWIEYPFGDDEDIKLLSELITKHDNLNKGIDELITEYYKLKIVNDELLEEATENNNNVKMQIYTQCIRYIKHTIESLEKLKGE